MQVTSAQAWVKGEEMAHSRDESRAGAGTSRGSQQGFFPAALQTSGRLWQKSHPLICPDREGGCVVGRKVFPSCWDLDFDSCFGSPPGELVGL